MSLVCDEMVPCLCLFALLVSLFLQLVRLVSSVFVSCCLFAGLSLVREERGCP